MANDLLNCSNCGRATNQTEAFVLETLTTDRFVNWPTELLKMDLKIVVIKDVAQHRIHGSFLFYVFFAVVFYYAKNAISM